MITKFNSLFYLQILSVIENKMNSIFICFIIFNLLHVSLCIDDLDFDDHFITNDDDCIKSYDEGLIKTSYIAKSMRRGLFKCAKEIVYKSTGGSSIEASNFFEIEQRNIIKEMQDLKNFIESSLPMPNVLPAFRKFFSIIFYLTYIIYIFSFKY